MGAPSPAPSADMIEAHRTWMTAGGFSVRTVDDACEVLYRVDRDLAARQRRTGEPHVGLAGPYPEELAGWLAGEYRTDEAPVPWSRQTIATYRQHIRRFYQWATDPDDPWLTYDPSVRLRRPKVHKSVPNPADTTLVEEIMRRAEQPWLLHCTLAAYAGLRPIEIADLRRDDVTATHIRIRSGKGAKPAVLPVQPAVWEAVRGLPPGPMTCKARGGPATALWVSSQTGLYLRKRLGIAVNLRRLRSWFATWLLDHGATIREVQELMRHENLQTTAGYTAVTEARLRSAILTLPRFDDAPAPGGPGAGPTESGSPSSPPSRYRAGSAATAATARPARRSRGAGTSPPRRPGRRRHG